MAEKRDQGDRFKPVRAFIRRRLVERHPPVMRNSDHAPLFHVSRAFLARGTRLHTNRFIHDHADLLQMLRRALAASLADVELLRSSDLWKRQPFADQVLLEALFERVRERIAPDRLSRLTSTFAWPTIAWARWFRDSYVSDGFIYRCSLQDGTILICDAACLIGHDFSRPIGDLVRTVESEAERYWSADQPTRVPEILIGGAAVVEERV